MMAPNGRYRCGRCTMSFIIADYRLDQPGRRPSTGVCPDCSMVFTHGENAGRVVCSITRAEYDLCMGKIPPAEPNDGPDLSRIGIRHLLSEVKRRMNEHHPLGVDQKP